jgi:hypothetical protein
LDTLPAPTLGRAFAAIAVPALHPRFATPLAHIAPLLTAFRAVLTSALLNPLASGLPPLLDGLTSILSAFGSILAAILPSVCAVVTPLFTPFHAFLATVLSALGAIISANVAPVVPPAIPPARALRIPRATSIVVVPVRADRERYDRQAILRTILDQWHVVATPRIAQIAGRNPAARSRGRDVAPRVSADATVHVHRGGVRYDVDNRKRRRRPSSHVEIDSRNSVLRQCSSRECSPG